jgi:hypothetical protein
VLLWGAEVGFALLGAGALLTMVGISLFFEKNLIRLGNVSRPAKVASVRVDWLCCMARASGDKGSP